MCRHGQTTVENDTKSTRWVDYWHSWRQHWHNMNVYVQEIVATCDIWQWIEYDRQLSACLYWLIDADMAVMWLMICSVSFWCRRENWRSKLRKSLRCLTERVEYVTAASMAELQKDLRFQIFKEVSVKCTNHTNTILTVLILWVIGCDSSWHNCTVERRLVVDICGQSQYCNRPSIC